MFEICNGNGFKVPAHICSIVAARGDLNSLKYAHLHGFELCDIAEAAEGGHLECLKYIFENGGRKHTRASYFTASGGHLECLKYLYECGNGFWPGSCEMAAINGNLDCLKYLHEHGCKWSNDESNHLYQNWDCLKYAIENGFEWNADIICEKAVMTGNLENLKYAHQTGGKLNNSCSEAAARESLICLKYLYENGCEWDIQKCCEAAIKKGNLECFKFLYEHGADFTTLSDCVILHGTFDIFKFFHEYGGNILSAELLAWRGNVRMMKYAHENGYIFNETDLPIICVSRRNLSCLKYAIENGCKWNCTTSIIMEKAPYVVWLKYARETGCQWDEKTCLIAKESKKTNCLKYAVEHGCPANT